jgi:uncharacterized protein YbjQ (UPF0145 family)
MSSVPSALWQWGAGELTAATLAHTRALATAVDRMHRECRQAGGHGVVGVRIEFQVHPTHLSVDLIGTAVRPVGARGGAQSPFISDLSARDFVLLHTAGWVPEGLAFGTAYVFAPRRGVGTVMSQRGQNVELTNFTQAIYAARESAMERMQQSAVAQGGKGMVDVQILEGPMHFARHVVAFACWGTAIRVGPAGHRHIAPKVILPIDDRGLAFDAASLRGGRAGG